MAYTEQQFNAYKKRLAEALIKHGMDSYTLYNDADMKSFINNYVQDHIIDKKDHYALQGIVMKLANMEINYSNRDTRSYPIINKYKGHDLIETIYFGKDENNSISVYTIPVVESSIILP